MEIIKNIIIKIRRHLDVSILVVPNNGTKIKRFASGKALFSLWVYSLLLVSLGYFSASLFHDIEYIEMSQTDVQRIKDLNEKVGALTSELEGIKESNKRLKNAILLADSTAFQKKNLQTTKKIQAGGNLYFIFRKIVSEIKANQQESYYFIKPAEGFLSRGFNPEKGHFGIDIVLKTGNPIYAAGNGYVVYSDFTPADGYMIIINHSNDFVTVYKHCSSILKRQRDYISQGDVIALSGNTGESTGPHLHFELWKRGVPLDPKEYFINQ
jgi:murein DD-endopeptidase MepM/ murein hydrolase activator NlpD